MMMVLSGAGVTNVRTTSRAQKRGDRHSVSTICLGLEWSARTRTNVLRGGESTNGASPSAGRSRSHHLQIFRRCLAAIAHELVFDLLTFVQGAQAGALDGRHMHEHVLPAVRRLNEAVAFGRIKPPHSSASHYRIS